MSKKSDEVLEYYRKLWRDEENRIKANTKNNALWMQRKVRMYHKSAFTHPWHQMPTKKRENINAKMIKDLGV